MPFNPSSHLVPWALGAAAVILSHSSRLDDRHLCPYDDTRISKVVLSRPSLHTWSNLDKPREHLFHLSISSILRSRLLGNALLLKSPSFGFCAHIDCDICCFSRNLSVKRRFARRPSSQQAARDRQRVRPELY